MRTKTKNAALSCFFIPLFVYSAFTVKAQTAETGVKKIYLQAGGGVTTHSGSNNEIGVQAVVNNKWSATFSYQSFSMKPANLPSDYQPETGIVFFFPYTKNITVDMKLFSLTAGKYFPISRNTWFTTEAGLSIVNGQKANFQPATQTTTDPALLLILTSITTSNYTTTIENKTTLGGMIRADLNWAFTSFMGLGAGVFANFNSIQSPIGANLKLTLGLMGTHKATKKGK